MRLVSAIAVLTLLAAAQPASAAPLAPPVAVEIPLPGSTPLRAELFKPEGDGPFPTVIALHGCGGLTGGHSEPVLPRYRDWAEQLLKDGKAVLLPDSYGSRGLGPQCRVKERNVRTRRERVADIVAARQWLMQQPWAAHDRISLIGWASGASALLWAVRPQLSRGAEPDFRSAIAFYPDCRISAGLGWSARVPTLLLIGAKDDVSSPPACRQMIEGARGRSALARIVVYPGAYHDFDRPNLPVHAVATGTNDAALPEQGHLGSDPDARADSQKLVADWLAR
jgi:dienelactone hydrolase